MPFSKNSPIGLQSFVAFLCFILITAAPPVDGKICFDIDVRNDPIELEKNLRNCTTVIGSVSISLIEKSNHTSSVNGYKFPELTEITGYLLLYRVFGLTSLRNLFPNLTVIRGERLISRYALIIYEMIALTEIGLTSLIKIQRGYVIIIGSPMICYKNTINWEAITQVHIGSGLGNYFDTYSSIACPLSCPDICPKKTCWNNKNCQLFDTGRSNTNKDLICHEECLGGCTNTTASDCKVCRHFRIKKKKQCVKECPSNLFAYGSLCVEADYCTSLHRKPIFGECRDSCPLIFEKYANVNVSNADEVEQCAKECPAIEVDSIATSDLLRGCKIIKGDILIRMQSSVPNTMEILERNLGDIEEIDGILKIYRSPVITSLSFFRNLRVIRGEADSGKEKSKYTFVLMSNENLVELWNWNEKTALQLVRGNLLVHFNSKLCLKQIKELQQILKTNTSADFISNESNGYEQTCSAIAIRTDDKVLNSSSVEISWNKIKVSESEKIAGYIVYLIVAPNMTVTHIGIDTCVQFGWQTHFIQAANDNDYHRSTVSTKIGNLTQNTQYAYYVKTQIVPKNHEDDVFGINQGLSNVKYFRTHADAPTFPTVETMSKTNTSIALSWSPTFDNELIEWYKVDVFIQPDEHEVLDRRDYCLYPRTDAHINVGVEIIPAIVIQSCSAEFENWKIANPDSTDPEYDWQIQRKIICAERAHERKLKEEKETEMLKYVDRHKIINCANDKNCHDDKTRFTRQIHSIFSSDGSEQERHDGDYDLGKYHIDMRIFDAQQLSANFPDLLPYTMYIFQFFSCNKISCSSYYFHYDRTDSSIYADDIPALTVSIDTHDSNQVHLDFIEPKTPNGLTVAFHIEKHDLSKFQVKTFCMPWKEYIANGKRYTFEHLDKGYYSFRVRSVSLALTGAYTEYQFINVYDKSYSIIAIIGIIFFICLFVILVGTVVIYFCRDLIHRLRVRSLNASTQNILMQIDESDAPHEEEPPSFYRTLTDDRDTF